MSNEAITATIQQLTKGTTPAPKTINEMLGDLLHEGRISLLLDGKWIGDAILGINTTGIFQDGVQGYVTLDTEAIAGLHAFYSIHQDTGPTAWIVTCHGHGRAVISEIQELLSADGWLFPDREDEGNVSTRVAELLLRARQPLLKKN